MSRGTLKRESMDTFAADVERLYNDPAYQRILQMTEDAVLDGIKNAKHDGSPEFENHERELCRQLRTLHSQKRIMMAISAGKTLREAQPGNDDSSGTSTTTGT